MACKILKLWLKLSNADNNETFYFKNVMKSNLKCMMINNYEREIQAIKCVQLPIY